MCSCTTVIWFTGGVDDIQGFNSLPLWEKTRLVVVVVQGAPPDDFISCLEECSLLLQRSLFQILV